MLKRTLMTLFAAATLAGCGPFWVDPYITVKESPLNWVEIHYYNMNRKPYRRISVLVMGSGHVELKKGTSDRVSNDFAKHTDDAEWENFRTQRVSIDPKHANDIFQHLVNYGLLDREKSFRGSDKDEYDRFIAVKANVSNYTYSQPDNIYEVDPDLAEQLYDVIREFDNPTL
ncbi:MAG: hypothetical protein IIZ70_00495 [Kiritimatiellae bacterium]|nr:hypothetical protein [Kiritimatiellia bacterium]